MVRQIQIWAVSLFLCTFMTAMAVYAQQPAVEPPPAAAPAPAAEMPAAGGTAAGAAVTGPATPAAPVVGGLTPTELNAPFAGSFFLTPLEIVGIQQALRGKAMAPRTLAIGSTPKTAIPATRVIRVSGVVYHSPDDWIVWMNGQKLTPGHLLPEIIEMKVKDSSQVDLLWFDAGLGQVFRISLRPQQTYDIGTGVLLPGGQ
jgi:hypothetical protein